MGAVKRQRQGGAVEFERQRCLVEGAVMDDLVALDVEERDSPAPCSASVRAVLERMQRRHDACLGDRVHPQPVGILDACRACGRACLSSARSDAQAIGDGVHVRGGRGLRRGR